MTTPTVLLAFGWTSLPMLGWLAVGAAPILIHLLSRRRYRRTQWAAMQYLLAAMRESRRRLRLEQWLLLLVRTLIIVLIVLAVADPYFESGGFLFTTGGARTHRVFVIDASYSMAYRSGEQSRFEQAKELAAQIVRASPQGDGFSLVLMGNPPRVLVDTPALSAAEFVAELESATRGDASFDLAATLGRVEQVLDDARRQRPGLERQEVYFLTDLCRVGWTENKGVRPLFAKRLSRQASLVVIDLGQPGADNLAVTRLRCRSSCVTLGKPAVLDASLHNFGRQNRKDLSVELWIDGRRIARRAADLPSGESRSVEFSHPFDTAWNHTVEVRLAQDRLAVDNRRWLVLPVQAAARVLCIDGRPGGGPLGSSTAYLTVALAPQDEQDPSGSVRPEVMPESAILETDLARYDCVFLCDVAQLTSNEARVLGDYVRAGGGLVLFLGDRVLADRYNRELLEKEPLLPARLLGIVENTTPGLDPLDYAHPIVEPFRGQEKAGLITTPVDKYFKLKVEPGTPARVALAMRSGDPLIVEQPVGRGRVVLVATSADTSWTAMPLWPSFVPVVQEIFSFAAGGRTQQHNLLVGQPLSGLLADASDGKEGLVVKPDGTEHSLTIHDDGSRRQWNFDDTQQSGIYTVRFGENGSAELRYGVNVDTIESNLDKLTEPQLRETVWPGVAFDYRTTWQASDRVKPQTIGRHDSLARRLLYLVLFLLLAETFLAWRFGYNTTRDI